MVLGLILAGGRSQRFGSEKAAARLGGVTLLERAHARLAACCGQVAVSAPAGSAAAELAAKLGAPLLEDPYGAPRGPLSGVLAGLDWATAAREELLLTTPCDALPPDGLEALLIGGIDGRPAAMAVSPEGPQPLCALWRTALARPLRLALADGLHPAVHRVLRDAGAAEVRCADAFLNLNTPEDLALAERRLAAGGDRGAAPL